MTAVAGHNKNFARFLILVGTSLLVLSPGLVTAWALLGDKLPVQPALKISCLILFLASVNFATVIMLDAYHRHFSRLSPPALLSMAAVVLAFVVFEVLRPYLPELSYGFLTPVLIVGAGFVYAALFCEKSLPLKCLFSLDGIALMFLWALGAADMFTMPF